MPSSSPPPGLADHALSNISSPLSEVDDKDADAEEMDLDPDNNSSSSLSNVNLDDDEDNENDGPDSRQLSDAENDDDGSSLSHIDTNDSEAETERLYDTPPKTNNIRDVPSRTPEARRRNSILARDRTFEPSPSKLRHQSRAGLGAIPNDDEDDSGSGDDAEVDADEADDDNASDASSESEKPANRRRTLNRATSPSPVKKTSSTLAKEKNTATKESGDASASDGRKRKRSPDAELSESDQPLRKRIGSVAAKDLKRNGDTPGADEDGDITTNPQSGEHSDAEADNEEITKNGDQTPSANAAGEILRRKSKRNNGKKLKDPDELGTDEEPPEEGADDNGAGTADDEAPEPEDDHAEPDIDEEAEAAHKNEEELERKRNAMDNIQGTEKLFTSFRDQLYQARLAQLEEEEAMLKGDNPTHPEYLAMIKCLQERRDHKMRIADQEYRLNTESRNRWAVARRAQIHSQFFQTVRQSREEVLEFLGNQWYQIQQQRRRHANTIPDFGIRFPGTLAQRTKDAIAYNKEVSILSGLAKHQGFPAAPTMKGASAQECEEDFEEIGIQPHRPGPHHQTQASAAAAAFVDLSGVSYTIGAAGQQYLADTPWANPKHPSHQLHLQRQHMQEPRTNSPLAGPSNRRQTQQHATVNGDSVSKAHHSPVPKSLKAIPDPVKQREAVA